MTDEQHDPSSGEPDYHILDAVHLGHQPACPHCTFRITGPMVQWDGWLMHIECADFLKHNNPSVCTNLVKIKTGNPRAPWYKIRCGLIAYDGTVAHCTECKEKS